MRHTLRFLLATSLTATLLPCANAQNMGINQAGSVPNASALLDIDVAALATKKGLLIPRMNFTQRGQITGLGAGDRGLWVYQLDNGTIGDATLLASVERGFWYWDGAAWQRWSGTGVSGNSWMNPGNANATATTYLGTSGVGDDLHIRTTSTGVNPQILITSAGATAGFVGMNPTAAPVERLDINGGLRVGNTALNTEGAIKFDDVSTQPNRWHFGNISGTATGWKRLENAEKEYTSRPYRAIAMQCQAASGDVTSGSITGVPPTGTNAGIPNLGFSPFPTNQGSQRRGYRAQYLYRASELQAAGLCAGNITEFSFYCMGNDVNGTPNGADLKVDVKMALTAQTDFGAFVASSGASLPVNWVGGLSAQIHANSSTAFLCGVGWLDFPLTGAGFPWDGVSNLVIDFSWQRAALNGNSPPAQMETMSYTATKWVAASAIPTTAHGNTYTDNPLFTNGGTPATGNSTLRPSTRFFGKIKTPGYVPDDSTGTMIHYAGGLVLDTDTGVVGWADANYRGPGTITARKAVYDGNVVLSDHVFDSYYAEGEPNSATGYAYVGVRDLKGYLEENRHLPSMPSRQEWATHGTPSLGSLQTGLWETVETQALHIAELEKDLRALESIAFGKNLDPAALQSLIDEVNNSRRLSDAQKLHLSEALRQRLNNSPSTK